MTTDEGAVRGTAVPGGYTFRGLPYAAAPTGDLRWQPPHPAERWRDVRDATAFAPSCPQPMSTTGGAQSEDCLYLNVSTPAADNHRRQGHLPVIVWFHGGGLVTGAGRDYDPSKLAAEGSVVVTVNYRLGALGYLAHPALASHDGSSGNYGLMDQQAALRWVQRNIGQFGGNAHKVAIAGESAGGESVLAHLTSPGSRGLFQRAIVQSGTFALNQLPLAKAEDDGKTFANTVGCTDQSADCLRKVPVEELVAKYPPSYPRAAIIDGKVLKESIGTSLAAGRFARVPVLDGSNHEEEQIILATRVTLHDGAYAPLPPGGVTAENYQQTIASVLGVTDARAKAVADEYPLASYASPTAALGTLLGDADFSVTAAQVDKWISKRTPTYAYEFNDDAAPARYLKVNPPVATHLSELPYLFDLPDAPLKDSFSADQDQLAKSMRAAWIHFAATGNPSTAAVHWPSFRNTTDVKSLVPPTPVDEKDFATRHHYSFWAAG
ncbi:carboxylesterase family protein [Streptomyces sp. NPDC007157]|uniref:carboxylesterase/lipase family protein n=1 Tax=Streptomyces sp. NPDC007157 TaxID=3154681 RepID=UPI0033C94E42